MILVLNSKSFWTDAVDISLILFRNKTFQYLKLSTQPPHVAIQISIKILFISIDGEYNY